MNKEEDDGTNNAKWNISNAFTNLKKGANHFTPQLRHLKDKTSKSLQPGIEKMKSTASAGIDKTSKSLQPGIEKMKNTASAGLDMTTKSLQPGLERMKHTASAGLGSLDKGMHTGWNRLQPGMAKFVSAISIQIFPSHESSSLVLYCTIANVSGQKFLYDYKARECLIPRDGNSKNIDSLSSVEKCFRTPYIIYTVLLFCGKVEVLTAVAGVHLACRTYIHEERRLWRYCVRYGGVTTSSRAPFWKHVTGSDFLRADNKKDAFDTYITVGKNSEWNDIILTDVSRTYSNMHRIPKHELEAVKNDLILLLQAMAGKFSELGYCQGMDYVGANVLRILKSHPASEQKNLTEEAFWLMVALFENYHLKEMFSPGLNRLKLCCYQFHRIFETALPRLSEYFTAKHITLEIFIVGWFQTLFVYFTPLPEDTLDRIWDIFLFERDWKIIFRAGIAFLNLLEPQIVNSNLDVNEINHLLNTFPENVEPMMEIDSCVHDILNMKITNSMLMNLQMEYDKHQVTESVESYTVANKQTNVI